MNTHNEMANHWWSIGYMDGDEIFILVMSALVVVAWLFGETFTSMNRLFFRRAAAAGAVRLAYVLSMVWVVYVLLNHADPSVAGVYRTFYFIMGLAVLVVFGLGGASRTGVRYRVDVLQRRNPAAGLLIFSFILATGMIFGGSLWGEADPTGDDEGGWWIPLGFFLAGWVSLLISTWLYRRRDTGGIRRRMRQVRNPWEVVGFSLYMLSCAWILTEAVAGDFYGWWHGLAAVGTIAAMLITRELVGLYFSKGAIPQPQAMRGVEVVFYVLWSAGYSLLSRFVLPEWGLPT